MINRIKNLKIMNIVLAGGISFSLMGCAPKIKNEFDENPLPSSMEDIRRSISVSYDKNIDNNLIIGFNDILHTLETLSYQMNFEQFLLTDEIINSVRNIVGFVANFSSNTNHIDGYYYNNLSEDGVIIVDALVIEILEKGMEIDSEMENYLNDFDFSNSSNFDSKKVRELKENINEIIDGIDPYPNNDDNVEDEVNLNASEKSNEIRYFEEDVAERNIDNSGWFNMIDINGTVLNWIYSYEAPKENCAIMIGTGSTTDGEGSYFIGHNPGPFECVYNLDYGNEITVYDSDGNYKIYYVCDMFEVSQDSYYEDIEARAMPGGETIALQTCSGRKDNMVKILVAK